MKFKKTTLKNGLRIITVPTPGNPSVTVRVMVETGSNYEEKKENGLSHFLEHMCFKGTVKRPDSKIIAHELDNLGAQNNAFTSNEWTGYYAKGERRHWKKFLDIVSDIYLNSTLPKAELETERGVILQEMSMYEDLPQRKVWDVLGELVYGDTPSGRTILGRRENIKGFSRDDFVNYRNKHYITEKTVVVISGDLKTKEVVSEVARNFKNIKNGKKIGKEKVVEKQKTPALKILQKDTEQTHVLMAFRAFGVKDKRSTATDLLATILGKGMSSRLWIKMREEMGACYYVWCHNDGYTDHGLVVIGTGIEARRTEEVVGALIGEAKKLKDQPVTDKELRKAKEQYLGHLYMSLETTDALTEFYSDQEIAVGKLKTPKEIEEEIRKITPKDIQKRAQEVFKNQGLNLAIIGDIKDLKRIKGILKF